MVYILVAPGAALIACLLRVCAVLLRAIRPGAQQRIRPHRDTDRALGAGNYIGYCAAIVASLLLTERIGALLSQRE